MDPSEWIAKAAIRLARTDAAAQMLERKWCRFNRSDSSPLAVLVQSPQINDKSLLLSYLSRKE